MMQSENKSLKKLKSIVEFLKSSGKFFFQNYNFKILLDFLEHDPEISIIINSLLSKNKHIKEKLDSLQTLENFKLNEVRAIIKNFDEYVALSLFYLKKVPGGGDKFINDFIDPADGTGAAEENKKRFYNECIKPIVLYVELEISSTINALYTLDRYKTLCKWFDKEKVLKMKDELEITKTHLSRYLFDSGFFNYSFTETTVPSGRIDNLAIGDDSVILVEGKFYKTRSSIKEVFNQVDKRIRDLGLYEGFCVVFNKMGKKLKIVKASGNVGGYYYIDINNARIYFVIIDLHADFYESTKTLPEVEIDVSTFN